MKKVRNLHDLVELGIRLHKKGVPNGFVVCIDTNPDEREQLYSDLLDMTSVPSIK